MVSIATRIRHASKTRERRLRAFTLFVGFLPTMFFGVMCHNAWCQAISSENHGSEPWKPIVRFSEEHQALSLVKVGDRFPEAELAAVDGTNVELLKRLGERLTVVVFWTKKHPYALEQFLALDRVVARPFGADKVQVIAVNVGDVASDVAKLTPPKESAVLSLVDTDESLWKLVAREKLPRTYVLDAAGKVLWFDIEYSLGTRLQLKNAIAYYLSRPAP